MSHPLASVHHHAHTKAMPVTMYVSTVCSVKAQTAPPAMSAPMNGPNTMGSSSAGRGVHLSRGGR